MKRARTAIALAAVLACATAAAGPARAADPSTSSGQGPFEIHAILPVTGGAAFLGKAESASLAAFADAVNKAGGIKGRPLKIVVEDDQTNPQIAVQLMNQVLATKPAVVFDGGPAATCRATAALVADGPVLYCLTPVVQTTPGGYVFSALYSTDAILQVSLRYLRERGLKRVAVLNGTDATGQAADEILQAAVKLPENARAGMAFVAYEHFNLTDLTVQAQLARIKAAAPQALIAFTTGTAIATVLHGVADVGLDVPIVTSPGNMAYGQMESYRGFLPKELLFAGSPLFVPDQVADSGVRRAVLAFGEALKPTGQRPDLLNVVAWDPANLVTAAFQKLGTGATAAALRKELAAVRNVPGVLGRYDFGVTPQRGISSNWVIVERWDPEKDAFVAVSKPGGGL